MTVNQLIDALQAVSGKYGDTLVYIENYNLDRTEIAYVDTPDTNTRSPVVLLTGYWEELSDG